MSLRNTYKTDSTKETEGVWVPVGINEFNNEPVKILVSRMAKSNKKYAKAIETKLSPHQAAIQNETMPEALAARLFREVFVDEILHDWENVTKFDLTGEEDDKTTPLEFSRENALALFKELPDLFDEWEKHAKRAANFREAEREVSSGN